MQYRAPAKINLRLVVLAREDTGYHQIETLFAAIELADALEITAAGPGIRLHAPAVPGPAEENLVHRAAAAFHEAAGISPAVDIVVEKNIPAGAGLGGGSSDAATTLLALDAMHGEPLGAPKLRRIGVTLGADVPFFLARTPLALAWGRGERLLPISPPTDAHVLIVIPPTPVHTADAYRALAERRRGTTPEPEALPAAQALSTWDGIARVACNDFEPVIAERIPEVQGALDILRDHGAHIARMSGSGSAVFGVFHDADATRAAEVAVAIGLPGVRTIPSRTAFSDG